MDKPMRRQWTARWGDAMAENKKNNNAHSQHTNGTLPMNTQWIGHRKKCAIMPLHSGECDCCDSLTIKIRTRVLLRDQRFFSFAAIDGSFEEMRLSIRHLDDIQYDAMVNTEREKNELWYFQPSPLLERWLHSARELGRFDAPIFWFEISSCWKSIFNSAACKRTSHYWKTSEKSNNDSTHLLPTRISVYFQRATFGESVKFHLLNRFSSIKFDRWHTVCSQSDICCGERRTENVSIWIYDSFDSALVRRRGDTVRPSTYKDTRTRSRCVAVSMAMLTSVVRPDTYSQTRTHTVAWWRSALWLITCSVSLARTHIDRLSAHSHTCMFMCVNVRVTYVNEWIRPVCIFRATKITHSKRLYISYYSNDSTHEHKSHKCVEVFGMFSSLLYRCCHILKGRCCVLFFFLFRIRF